MGGLHFDLTAVQSETLVSFPVKVKCNTAKTLVHSQIDRWIETHVDDSGIFSFGDLIQPEHPKMFWIMVNLPDVQIEKARYYLFNESTIQKLIVERFLVFIERHNYRRPNGGCSRPAILTVRELLEFEDNWAVLDSS